MTRAQSAKKLKKSDILTDRRVSPKANNKPEIRMQYPKKEDAINFLISKNSENSSKKTGIVWMLCMGGRVDRADGRMVL